MHAPQTPCSHPTCSREPKILPQKVPEQQTRLDVRVFACRCDDGDGERFARTRNPKSMGPRCIVPTMNATMCALALIVGCHYQRWIGPVDRTTRALQHTRRTTSSRWVRVREEAACTSFGKSQLRRGQKRAGALQEKVSLARGVGVSKLRLSARRVHQCRPAKRPTSRTQSPRLAIAKSVGTTLDIGGLSRERFSNRIRRHASRKWLNKSRARVWICVTTRARISRSRATRPTLALSLRRRRVTSTARRRARGNRKTGDLFTELVNDFPAMIGLLDLGGFDLIVRDSS